MTYSDTILELFFVTKRRKKKTNTTQQKKKKINYYNSFCIFAAPSPRPLRALVSRIRLHAICTKLIPPYDHLD